MRHDPRNERVATIEQQNCFLKYRLDWKLTRMNPWITRTTSNNFIWINEALGKNRHRQLARKTETAVTIFAPNLCDKVPPTGWDSHSNQKTALSSNPSSLWFQENFFLSWSERKLMRFKRIKSTTTEKLTLSSFLSSVQLPGPEEFSLLVDDLWDWGSSFISVIAILRFVSSMYWTVYPRNVINHNTNTAGTKSRINQNYARWDIFVLKWEPYFSYSLKKCKKNFKAGT